MTLLALPGVAAAGIFGTYPLNISVTAGGDVARGPSGGAAVSGDNRKGRLAAFHSEAANLVAGDTNGVADVFAWRRPRGSRGLRLPSPARPAGAMFRASVGPGGRQANGPSLNPSLDGSVTRPPRCVAFQSKATNLSPGDRSPDWDIYVRNLAGGRTVLVSRGVPGEATDPSIDGACRRVAFEATNKVYVGSVATGGARSLGAGQNPDFSLDGSAIAWERAGTVMLSRNGKRTVVAPGENPRVSDAERLKRRAVWGVTFDTKARLTRRDRNSGYDVYMRVFGPEGRAKRTDLISAAFRGGPSLGGESHNGGITAYAPNRGILTFTNTHSGQSTLYYRNNNSGNIDDLAHAVSADGGPAIWDVATSARANFVAFTSTTGQSFSGGRRGGGAPGQQAVFFKHLIDGEPL